MSKYSSFKGCGASFGYIQEEPKNTFDFKLPVDFTAGIDNERTTAIIDYDVLEHLMESSDLEFDSVIVSENPDEYFP